MKSIIEAKLGLKVLIAAVMCAGFGVAAQANTVTDFGTLAVPSSQTYADTFLAPTTQFYDDYTFAIPAATFDSITATIDLGKFFSIDNLQARLFSGTGPFVDPNTTPIVQKWSTAINAVGATGEVVVIDPHVLGAGPYTLEIRGDVTGVAGGSYSGVLNLSPVPEPSPKVAILAGLGLLGFQLSRKMKSRN